MSSSRYGVAFGQVEQTANVGVVAYYLPARADQPQPPSLGDDPHASTDLPLDPAPGAAAAFLISPADELLYGGAAGGGKSDALLAEAVPDLDKPGFHALLLRRTYPELEGKGSGLIPRAEELWSSLGGRFDRHKLLWTFPSGATVGFGHLEHPSSVYAYHSAQFAYIAFDELTTFLESQYLYMLSRLRSPAGIRARVRAASNPGGIGHAWVRRRFIEKLRPGEIRWFRRASSGEVAAPPLQDASLRARERGSGAEARTRHFALSKLGSA